MYISGQWLGTIGPKIFGNLVANAMKIWYQKLFFGLLCILLLQYTVRIEVQMIFREFEGA